MVQPSTSAVQPPEASLKLGYGRVNHRPGWFNRRQPPENLSGGGTTTASRWFNHRESRKSDSLHFSYPVTYLQLTISLNLEPKFKRIRKIRVRAVQLPTLTVQPPKASLKPGYGWANCHPGWFSYYQLPENLGDNGTTITSQRFSRWESRKNDSLHFSYPVTYM
ncbi:hypothetical protein GW17_00060844 [Ensete ventricosum]|nr:hypothetical protein GW17_00060844 [Ensete ventricosum]